jgi:hypothetical protein
LRYPALLSPLQSQLGPHGLSEDVPQTPVHLAASPLSSSSYR